MFLHPPHHRSEPRARRGFTLIELLIVIGIIGILSAMALVALTATQGRVRVDRTKETIAKLNSLVMAKWESYRTRRIPALPVTAISGANVNVNQELALARLDYLRELMRLEMPDRFADIIDDPVLPDPASTAMASPYSKASWSLIYADTATFTPDKRMSRPAVSLAYRMFCQSRGITTLAQVTNNIHTNQNAECLFMLVTMGLEGATSRELFSEDEIGDTDGDGFPEFLDGWGRPIRFLRWAPGYSSSTSAPTGAFTTLQSADLDSSGNNVRDPDPFDPLKLDMRDAATNVRVPPTPTGYAHFALYPFIYSAGPDGGYGIVDGILGDTAQYEYSRTNPRNDPYHNFGIPFGTVVRKHAQAVSAVDFSQPTRPTVTETEYVSSLLGDEQYGDSFDNIHNQMEPLTR